METILKQIISKVHYSAKNVAGNMVLVLCMLSDAAFIYVPNFMKIFLTVLKLQSGQDCRLKNFKEA